METEQMSAPSKKETWETIVEALQQIDDAAEMLVGFDLSPDDVETQADIIKHAAQRVRSAAHDYIQPGSESKG